MKVPTGTYLANRSAASLFEKVDNDLLSKTLRQGIHYLIVDILLCKNHLKMSLTKETFYSEKGRQLPDEFVCFFVCLFKQGKI